MFAWTVSCGLSCASRPHIRRIERERIAAPRDRAYRSQHRNTVRTGGGDTERTSGRNRQRRAREMTRGRALRLLAFGSLFTVLGVGLACASIRLAAAATRSDTGRYCGEQR